jgi:uncharacterized membrane protein (DUF485 family)
MDNMKIIKRIKHHFQHEVLKIEWVNNEKQLFFSFQTSYFFFLYLSLIGLISFFAIDTKPIAVTVILIGFLYGVMGEMKDSFKRRNITM